MAPGLILQVRRRGPQEADPTGELPLRVGFTCSRKVGNAVARNRAKRRLRALAEDLLPRHAAPGHDYVLIGRQTTVTRPFDELRQDLVTALKRMKVWRDEAGRDEGTTDTRTAGTRNHQP